MACYARCVRLNPTKKYTAITRSPRATSSAAYKIKKSHFPLYAMLSKLKPRYIELSEKATIKAAKNCTFHLFFVFLQKIYEFKPERV